MKKLSLLLVLLLTACEAYHETADQKESRRQNQMTAQAQQQVGLPAIVNFQEKRMMKQILELRDTTISTTTYIVDLYGKLHKVCDSIGYGLPYATQYTNPQQDTFYNSSSATHVVIAQPDPNGLYSPPSAEGTWILCLNPETNKSIPVYIEPRVIVSPFPLTLKP